MRTGRLLVVVLTALSLLGAPVAAVSSAAPRVEQTADDGPGPGPDALDLPSLTGSLRTQPVTTAPGAVAVYDPAVVLPELAADTRLLLAPFDPRLERRYDDEVVQPLRDVAAELGVAVILVTGLDVRVVDGRPGGSLGGSPTVSSLAGLQVLLGSSDVTDLVLVATRVVADVEDVSSPDPVPDTPVATAAEAAPVVAGLRGSPRWAAPGTDPDLAGALDWDGLLSGVGLRVATLPPVERGAPQPDLVPALTAAFPGEVVVVVRGRWIDVAGPDQPALTSARDWALGRYADFFTARGTSVDALLRVFLERAEELRTGNPFARDPLAPTTLDRLVQRWVPPVALVVALALLAGSGTLTARRLARRTRVDAAGERARALAELAALDADLLASLDTDGGFRSRYAVATAAERRDTARTLFDASDDAGTSTVVREAVAESRAALAEADR